MQNEQNNTMITNEVKAIAAQKSKFMPLGAFSRLKINNEISDIVIQTSSSGIYFYLEPKTIGKDITEKIIGFFYYSNLNKGA